MWYVGVDWADQKQDALVLEEAGRQVGSMRVAHTPEGLAQLDALRGKTACFFAFN